MNAAAFKSLADRAVTAVTAMAGEDVTIGAWTGKAIVNGGPHFLANVEGGTYSQDNLVISVTKADLGVFLPLPQMNVTARGKALRIPDEGIVEYADRFVITAAGRNVPATG
jgi:hypothetical protein